jgi:uncharacterized membrane protein (UPF0127 family)
MLSMRFNPISSCSSLRFRMQRRTILLAILAVPIFAGRLAAADPSALTIETASGKQPFTVELASTPDQMALGLMFRQSMPADAGMLFLYPSEQRVEFWMKNTFIPLDMLFIGADGHIKHIAQRTIPLDETPIPSVEEVRAVLEVNGGTVERLGIKTGDMVRSPALGNQ